MPFPLTVAKRFRFMKRSSAFAAREHRLSRASALSGTAALSDRAISDGLCGVLMELASDRTLGRAPRCRADQVPTSWCTGGHVRPG